jgi:hypothetical protein
MLAWYASAVSSWPRHSTKRPKEKALQSVSSTLQTPHRADIRDSWVWRIAAPHSPQCAKLFSI